MGSDTNIYLPANVRAVDVAKVIGALLGERTEKRHFSQSIGGGWSADNASRVEPTTVPTMAMIYIGAPGEMKKSFYYHFECSEKPGCRLVSAHNTPKVIAVGRALVDFFGGSVVYNDCADTGNKPNYQRTPKSDEDNCPNDGTPWYHLQQRIIDIKPIGEAELEKVRPFASYKD